MRSKLYFTWLYSFVYANAWPVACVCIRWFRRSVAFGWSQRRRQQKRKQCACKPGSVPPRAAAAPAIYLSRMSPRGLSALPSIENRAGNPRSMVYMNLLPPESTARRSPADWWSLTPPSHPYLARRRGGCFLLLYPTVANSFYFQKWSALRSPDFPLAPSRCQRQAGTLFPFFSAVVDALASRHALPQGTSSTTLAIRAPPVPTPPYTIWKTHSGNAFLLAKLIKIREFKEYKSQNRAERLNHTPQIQM